MDYQIKPKQAKHGSTDQEIFKAITDFQTSGISTEDFKTLLYLPQTGKYQQYGGSI